MQWSRYHAVLFDLDGVITPTAEVHMRAWALVFEPFLASLPGQPPYTDDDYYAHLDGKPRLDGIRDLLAARGVDLPERGGDGGPSVASLGESKNHCFQAILSSEGIRPFPGAASLIRELEHEGLLLGVVSSSRNARHVLLASGLAGMFDVVVDGDDMAAAHLEGKPAPDGFLHAADLLGVPPEGTVVVEDALAGVEAGAAGGFALVIAVDRGAGAKALRAAGAHLVVADLGELGDL